MVLEREERLIPPLSFSGCALFLLSVILTIEWWTPFHVLISVKTGQESMNQEWWRFTIITIKVFWFALRQQGKKVKDTKTALATQPGQKNLAHWTNYNYNTSFFTIECVQMDSMTSGIKDSSSPLVVDSSNHVSCSFPKKPLSTAPAVHCVVGIINMFHIHSPEKVKVLQQKKKKKNTTYCSCQQSSNQLSLHWETEKSSTSGVSVFSTYKTPNCYQKYILLLLKGSLIWQNLVRPYSGML